MTGGDIAGLIAAGVFAVLVALLAIPILKLGRVFDELRIFIRDLNDETEPLLEEVTRTVATTNSQLEKVDVITDSVSDASANVSAMTSLVASTVGQPLIKTAAFSSGVRRAFSADAVRARREERRRTHAAQTTAEAAAQTAAEAAAGSDSVPGADARPDGAAGSGRTAGSTATARAAGAAGAAGTDAPTAWWEGTEWDTSAETADETMGPVIIESDTDPGSDLAGDLSAEQDPAPRPLGNTGAAPGDRTGARPAGPGGRDR